MAGGNLVAASLSVANLKYMLQGNYFEISPDGQPFLHYWSLSVEEQIYIFLPVLFLGIGIFFKLNRRVYLSVFCILAIISSSLFIFPGFLSQILREGFTEFGKSMKGYLTNEAILHAPESRTSSPVRIPRDGISLEHLQIKGLYPCGEGAGYAGGIISAAIDGEKCALKIAESLHQ